jgi:putative ATP-grasp target RiPP
MPAQSPWGLTRLAPFAAVTVVPPYTIELDPETQTGRCVLEDGSVVNFGHRKTYKATETPTQVSKGDGGDHKQYDPDKDQDSEED